MTSTKSNSPHHEASSTIAQATKFTTASKNNQNDINCVGKSNDSTQNDSTSNSAGINSHVDHSITLSTQIKKKSASFLHRDYNRKPILARSQVSMALASCVEKEGRKKWRKGKSMVVNLNKLLLFSRVIFSILYYILVQQYHLPPSWTSSLSIRFIEGFYPEMDLRMLQEFLKWRATRSKKISEFQAGQPYRFNCERLRLKEKKMHERIPTKE